MKLQADCEAAAIASGFPPERRDFKPHLTLGRWRDPAPRPKLPAADLGPVVLDRLVLFRSELRPAGAEYSPLAVFPLG
jgi:2'-5' RNA ligase